MERQVWVLRIKEGKEEEYVEAHRNVWPELIRASRSAGFLNHTVFLSSRTIIAYLEAEDIEKANARLKDTDVKQRWDLYMSDLLDSVDSPPFEEVFHFD